MLFLLFRIGNDRYALDTASILEVLPLVERKALPGSEPGVAGVIAYRGATLPLVDLGALTLGRSAVARLSTRIIVTEHVDASGTRQVLGLIAEHATEMARLDAADFADSGVSSGSAAYLGPIARGPGGLIQRIEPGCLPSARA